MYIDIHHHLIQEEEYVDKLLREMDRLDIEKTCVSALGYLFPGLFQKGTVAGDPPDNKTLHQAVKNHPNRIIGFGFLRPGCDDASLIDEGVVDSVGVMELVTWVGARFQIDVLPEDITPDNFDSVNQLASYIRSRLAASAAALADPAMSNLG